MRWCYSVLCFGLVISFQIVYGQRVNKLCTTSRFENDCTQLQRGNSAVLCERVQDSIECALKIRNGTADFGVFTAESALQLASLGWSDLTVVKELRHRDRMGSINDFESVVVVRADHQNGILGLRGLNFCHPGYYYDRSQRWTEKFLKHFERTVVTPDCQSGITSPAEIETAALASFFNSACRPGSWSNNVREDAELKSKYPQLCSLCNTENPSNCSYGTIGNNHQQALDCLRTGGQVAYVSLEDAQNYFLTDNPDIADQFAFLCPNGTVETIFGNAQPCRWLSQPWKLIIASSTKAIELNHQINSWMRSSAIGIWETAVREIIQADSYFVNDATIQAPRDYFRPFRDVPVELPLCSTQAAWCTSSIEEKEKCDVVRAGGITTGVHPIIECKEPASSVISCLSDINLGRADFTGIDSNFGFLARHTYNLTSAVYAETENAKYSSVVVVIKTNSSYERFENLKNSKACFPEFGGIASMAFINVGKNRGFFPKNECNYGRLLSNYFGSSCAPGATDFGHDPGAANSESLCSLCRMTVAAQPPLIITPAPRLDDGELETEAETEVPTDEPVVDETIDLASRATDVITNCNANSHNRFYGNKGALSCLHEEGDVAILELQYLREHAVALGIDENNFRIMCKNGSLADRTGFDVDEDCPLTTIIDNEIVVQPGGNKTAGIVNALTSFDRYFSINPDFKMYNEYNGYKHLLFKDSTLGLVSPDEEELGQSVQNYKQLFSDLEGCVQGSSASIPLGTIAAVVLSVVVALSIS